MQEPSVADELAWEALPEETRLLAERHFLGPIERKFEELSDRTSEAYSQGYQVGYRAGRAWHERNAHGSAQN